MRRYASSQLVSWLYARLAASFQEMTDLSKESRKVLAERYRLSALARADELIAPDLTRKLLLATADGLPVECVLIPAEEGRSTACLSTQAGCAMGCAFCRTAESGLKRNLTLGEITGQLVELCRESASAVTNVVFMGMGEPLANMEAVIDAIEILRDRRAFNLSRRRITLSTCGVIPKLREFVRLCEVKIAVSLNATTDEVRQRLMPVNSISPISEIMRFAREYGRTSRDRITFEYVMMRGVNDSRDDAARLSGLLKGLRAKINLIPFNPYEGSGFEPPAPETVEWWSEYLRSSGVQVNVRQSRGAEIMAACGQLAAKKIRNA